MSWVRSLKKWSRQQLFIATRVYYNGAMLSRIKTVLSRKHTHCRIHVLGLSALLFLAGISIGWLMRDRLLSQQNPQVQGEIVEKTYPLLQYSFPRLMQRQAESSEIVISREAARTPDAVSYVFSYTSQQRKISGMINVPIRPVDQSAPLPVLIMLRGYVPPEEYEIGKGTQHVAIEYVKKGYITIAPDFLGHGESDAEPSSALFEGRFIKPLNITDLLASVDRLGGMPLMFNGQPIAYADTSRIGMWGHSNGGQIALSVLEITGRAIPTTLWAPVTKQFPYSVLYFTDEYEDQGKGLRAAIAAFEQDYNIDEFTIGEYVNRITGKMLLHQGTNDDAVPKEWSDDFHSLVFGKGMRDQIAYYVYPQADHGLYPFHSTVIARDIAFFDKELQVKRGFVEILPR